MYSEEFDQNEIVTMFSPSTANVSMKKESGLTLILARSTTNTDNERLIFL